MTRTVLVVPPSDEQFSDEHEQSTRTVLAALLAEILDAQLGGELRGEAPQGAYLLPSETLLLNRAQALGVSSEEDFFGGVVPRAFIATKAISHPLVTPDAAAPEGWQQLGREADDAVLNGFTAFSRKDAHQAARALQKHGRVRIKPVDAVAGKGQLVPDDEAELAALIDEQDWDKLGECGLTLEQDIAEPSTYSVGQARVGGLLVSYYGLQKETDDNDRETTYGGSVLTIVRGGYDALLGLDLPQGVRLAIRQAQKFDSAVESAYPDFFASRRNYDVLQGFDRDGRLRSGVLEQSWRLGGASGAELLALKMFKERPDLQVVKARTVELFGEGQEAPPGALVLFDGVDPRVGPLVKYAAVETDE